MDEEPGVHAGHARPERRPRGALHGLAHERVLGHQQLHGFRQGGAELLELLHGQALVPDAGDEVAVLELLLHGLHGLLLLGAADGAADGGGREAAAAVVVVVAAGDGPVTGEGGGGDDGGGGGGHGGGEAVWPRLGWGRTK